MTHPIHTEELSKRYGAVDALSSVSLAVPQGAIYALMGANGAGKTTLIKMLMNLFRPSGGAAQVLGIDSKQLAGATFNSIGYVSENQEMPDWMTVVGFLDYVRTFYPHWDTGLEQSLLQQFDLPLNRKLKQLSRGMKMKAAFASILAYRPELIVLDEPFTGLDPLVRDELIESLLDQAPGTTIFLSSHDLAEIESFASHVGYLEQGRLVFSEEMSTLSGRFREVEVTLNTEAPTGVAAAAHWLQFETSGAVVRFVDSEYSEHTTPAKLAGMFPHARDITFNAMSLREIFLAIAKASRATGVDGKAKQTISGERRVS